MAKLARCDNRTCEKYVPEGANYFELTEINAVPTFANSGTDKQFCSLGCVSEYAARVCGWTGGN